MQWRLRFIQHVFVAMKLQLSYVFRITTLDAVTIDLKILQHKSNVQPLDKSTIVFGLGHKQYDRLQSGFLWGFCTLRRSNFYNCMTNGLLVEAQNLFIGTEGSKNEESLERVEEHIYI